jgi:hypothetical protein
VAAIAVRSPAHTRVPWIQFFITFPLPVSGYQAPYETGPHSSSSEDGYLGWITGRLQRDRGIIFAGQLSLFGKGTSAVSIEKE